MIPVVTEAYEVGADGLVESGIGPFDVATVSFTGRVSGGGATRIRSASKTPSRSKSSPASRRRTRCQPGVGNVIENRQSG